MQESSFSSVASGVNKSTNGVTKVNMDKLRNPRWENTFQKELKDREMKIVVIRFKPNVIVQRPALKQALEDIFEGPIESHLEALGTVRERHVWEAVCKSPEDKSRLLGAGVIRINGDTAQIYALAGDEVVLRIFWASYRLPPKMVEGALEACGLKVAKGNQYYEHSTVPGMTKMSTLVLTFVVKCSDRSTIPTRLVVTVQGQDHELLVVIPGQKPKCLKCNFEGHIASKCKNYCNYCKELGHYLQTCPKRPNKDNSRSKAPQITDQNEFPAVGSVQNSTQDTPSDCHKDQDTSDNHKDNLDKEDFISPTPSEMQKTSLPALSKSKSLIPEVTDQELVNAGLEASQSREGWETSKSRKRKRRDRKKSPQPHQETTLNADTPNQPQSQGTSMETHTDGSLSEQSSDEFSPSDEEMAMDQSHHSPPHDHNTPNLKLLFSGDTGDGASWN